MNTINIKYFKTAYGELILGSHENQLIMCDWRYRKMRKRIDNRLKTITGATYKEENDSILEITCQQLNEYFQFNKNTLWKNLQLP